MWSWLIHPRLFISLITRWWILYWKVNNLRWTFSFSMNLITQGKSDTHIQKAKKKKCRKESHVYNWNWYPFNNSYRSIVNVNICSRGYWIWQYCSFHHQSVFTTQFIYVNLRNEQEKRKEKGDGKRKVPRLRKNVFVVLRLIQRLMFNSFIEINHVKIFPRHT